MTGAWFADLAERCDDAARFADDLDDTVIAETLRAATRAALELARAVEVDLESIGAAE